jgi:hypothetical protein
MEEEKEIGEGEKGGQLPSYNLKNTDRFTDRY